MITTFTTVLGLLLLPMAQGIDSPVHRPLARAVVFGGLVSSLALTLLLLPVVYSLLAPDPAEAH